MIATHDEEGSHRLFDISDRVDVSRDRARLSVLAEVGLLLASSNDHLTILHKLPDLAVPALADWCSVHIATSTGQLERIALRHVDPSRVARADLIAQTTDADRSARGVARVFATARSELYEHVPHDLLAHREPTQRDALTQLGFSSYIAVPLVVRGCAIGVVTFVRAEPGHEYDHDDLAFAEELARRVAMFVDNAMLLREVHAREAALRDEAARLETLNRVGQELAAIHDLDLLVKKVVDAATTLTGAEVGVYVTDVDGAATYALSGTTLAEARVIAERHRDPAPTTAAFALKRALRLDDVRRMSPTPELGALAAVSRVASYLAVPVRGRAGDVIGGIALGHSRVGAFDERAEQLAIGLALMTATATESARLFGQAQELIAALETSNRDLDQFADVTSHDLRAPLRGIANLTTWVEQDLGDRLTAQSREHLQLLRGRVRRLEDLIQGVLDYSRAGRVADPPAVVESGQLVREVLELLDVPASVEVVVDPQMPTLTTARVALQRVFLNLIANAISHNTNPSPRIEIGADPVPGGWQFYVRDNGPGIPPRYHARVWGLFQTLGARDHAESTGIGLAIVRRTVEMYGGRAWIDSEERAGATFRFTWPHTPPRARSWERHPRPRSRSRG